MFHLFGRKEKQDHDLYAPVTGTLVALEQVPDEVFAGKMMGDGVAFDFTGDTLYAPCNGEVIAVAATKHAIGFKTEHGAEVLMHVGLDTVELNGEGFQILVEMNQQVKKGEPVMKIDRDFMKSRDICLTTPLVVTNSQEHSIHIEEIAAPVSAGTTKVISFL